MSTLHFKIYSDITILKFHNTCTNTEKELICKKSESLSDVINRLFKEGSIGDDGDIWKYEKNGLSLNTNVSIESLNLNHFDVIQLVKKSEIDDTRTVLKVTLYGCPSSEELQGLVPDCINVLFEDFDIIYR